MTEISSASQTAPLVHFFWRDFSPQAPEGFRCINYEVTSYCHYSSNFNSSSNQEFSKSCTFFLFSFFVYAAFRPCVCSCFFFCTDLCSLISCVPRPYRCPDYERWRRARPLGRRRSAPRRARRLSRRTRRGLQVTLLLPSRPHPCLLVERGSFYLFFALLIVEHFTQIRVLLIV